VIRHRGSRRAGKDRLRKLAELTGRFRGRRRSRLVRFFGVRRTVGLVMLAYLLALRIWDPAPLEDLRLRSFDFFQVLKPRIPTVKPVVIVDIDEDSLRLARAVALAAHACRGSGRTAERPRRRRDRL
jgi:hypothetical protein